MNFSNDRKIIWNQLGTTAQWTAAVRMLESQQAEALFVDPWAERLAGESGKAWLAGRSTESLLPIVLRTRFFDDWLAQVNRQEGARAVVLMAAGMDTRAYRLEWLEGTHLFEIDQAEILASKDEILNRAGAQATCQHTIVAADLTGAWIERLLEAGFEPSQPSAWLLEGFLFYLTEEVMLGLLDRVCAFAAPGSWLGFDCMNSLVMSSPYTRAWVEMQAQLGAPWQSWLDDPLDFLGQRGWQGQLTSPGQPGVNYERWRLPVIPLEAPGLPHHWLVTAKKEKMR